MEKEPRLVDYPHVVVRVACRFCRRRGRYRLARLADKWGADITLEELLDRLAATCPYPRPSQVRKLRKYQPFCGILLPDLEYPPPGAGPGLRLVEKEEDVEDAA